MITDYTDDNDRGVIFDFKVAEKSVKYYRTIFLKTNPPGIIFRSFGRYELQSTSINILRNAQNPVISLFVDLVYYVYLTNHRFTK